MSAMLLRSVGCLAFRSCENQVGPKTVATTSLYMYKSVQCFDYGGTKKMVVAGCGVSCAILVDVGLVGWQGEKEGGEV